MSARTLRSFAQNIIDFPRAVRPSAALAGLLATLVGYSGPMLIAFQAAEAGKLSQDQLSSWVWATAIGTGICAILLSLWYRHPVLCAWGSGGAVLMVTGLAQFSLPEAVGAYLVAAVGVVLLGLSGLFSKLMALVPKPIVSALIAGVIFRFGIGLFTELPKEPLLILPMALVFFALKRMGSRAPSIGAMLVGVALAALLGKVNLAGVSLQLTNPVFTWPVFTLQAMLSLALPLFLLTNTQQNAPGIAVLRTDGYDTPAEGPLILTGLVSALTAPFGNHGLNLAAITAAIGTGPEAHPDKDLRYSTGVSYGLWYLLFGIFGSTAVALMTSLPRAVVSGVAGLALLGAVAGGMHGAMAEPRERDGALVTFMLTVSSIELFGIGSPFWGLVAGVLVNLVLNWRRAAKQPA
jgi:benzoate membrane transport protein